MAKPPYKGFSENGLTEGADETTRRLNAALTTGEMRPFMATLSDLARSRGLARVAQDTGLGRESLYKSMRPTSEPSFSTVVRVIRSLGLDIQTVSRSSGREEIDEI